jgi:hypothetical protein
VSAAGLGRATVARFELGELLKSVSVEAMRQAFDRGGVELIELGAMLKPGKGGVGDGVRLPC